MRKFLLYDYGNNHLVWSSKLIVDEPSLLEDCQEGLCDYVATIFVEKNVARFSSRIGVPILKYASEIEGKVRQQHSKSLIVFHEHDQNKKLINFFIAHGWVIRKLNPDTVDLYLKGG
jgi:hypothetical protein